MTGKTPTENQYYLITKNKYIHFIGIGGAGMSAIARVLLELKYKITGSDLRESVNTIRLKDFNAKIYYGHDKSNIREAGIVVVSTAIDPNNPELIAAKEANIPILHRADMLNFLMTKFPKRISVAGTHGKTTTTSMITGILNHARKDPTYLIGAAMNELKGNAALGKGEYIVAESDESDGSFLKLDPNITVITNIEAEHMCYFKTEENLEQHFLDFMKKTIAANGYLVLNQDDLLLQKLAEKLPKSAIINYGLSPKAQIRAEKIAFAPNGTSFQVIINEENQGKVQLKIHGNHNVYNALAAIAVGLKENIPLAEIKHSLNCFTGTSRRLQLIGKINGITILDDYGHHPTEISTTLLGIRQSFNQRLICIFQPHRFTRTHYLLDQFISAFDSAHQTIITDIYAAGEENSYNISSEQIVQKMQEKNKKDMSYIANKSQIAEELLAKLKSGDIVVTMGAGDIYTVGKEILARLKQQKKAKKTNNVTV